jgi:hypothetical protein
MVQAAAPAKAWAENTPNVRVCSLVVKPEFTPLSEISPYFIDALIAAEDPNFYIRAPEQAARVFGVFKALQDVAASNKPAIPNNPTPDEEERFHKAIGERFREIGAYIAAEDSKFYTRTPEAAARVYKAYQAIKAAAKSNMLETSNGSTPEENERGYEAIRKAILEIVMLPDEDMNPISRRLVRCANPDLPRGLFGFDRRIAEFALLIPIERELSKNTILQLYVNQIFLGRGEYGVSAASQAYFGKPAQDLTLAEAAFLAGIPEKHPFTSYRRHTEVLDALVLAGKITSAQAEAAYALERRNEILDAMIQAGKITSLQAEAAKAEPLDLKPPRTNATNVGQVRGP